jgi:hypothetical protein
MRVTSKAVTIPASQTDAQLTTALNGQLSKGWVLVSVFTYGTKTIAVFVKETAQ